MLILSVCHVQKKRVRRKITRNLPSPSILLFFCNILLLRISLPFYIAWSNSEFLGTIWQISKKMVSFSSFFLPFSAYLYSCPLSLSRVVRIFSSLFPLSYALELINSAIFEPLPSPFLLSLKVRITHVTGLLDYRSLSLSCTERYCRSFCLPVL